jgi:PAS domain S-box-containing protein
MPLRFADWPLRAKMAALLAAVSLLPLALWAAIDLRQDQARVLDGMKRLLEARGDQIVHELDSFHRGYQRAVGRIARFPDSAAYCADTPDGRAARLGAMLGILSAYPASDPGIRGAALIDGTGRIVIATEAPLIGLDLSDRPVVRAALQGQTVISDPFISSPRSGSIPTIAYAAPMPGSGRGAGCVAMLWVRAASLWQTVKASDALAGPGSFAVLFDRDGIRIAHTSSDDLVFHPGGPLDPATLERLVAERRFGTRTRELLEDVRPFPEQFARARAATPDAEVFRGFAPVAQTWNYGVARRFATVPWTVFYMVPEAAAATAIAQATRERLFLALSVMAIAGLVGLAFAATILRPVRRLRELTASIAGGDLAARVVDARGDEFGQLGRGFNAMAEQIQAHTSQLQAAHDELERRVDERTADLAKTAHRLEAEIVERSRMEAVLRERDAALHRAHAMSKLAHVITGPDGAFESWSQTLPPLIGVAPAQMPQSTREWMRLLHDEDRATFRSASIAAAVTGASEDIEYRLKRGDGAWIHVHQVIEPIPGPADSGGRTRWFSTLQDVTDQRRAQEDLRASQQLLQAIVDNSAAVIYVKDLEGRYLLVNRRYSEIFRISNEAIVGKSDHELFAKEAADAFRSMDQRVAAADAALIEEEVAPLSDGPHTYVSVKCPLRDRDGRVYGIFGISTDITDRKQAEDALRASEEHTRLIIETSLDAVVTMDDQGLVTGWSPQAETTFGWTRAEVLGRSLAQTIIPERHREAHRLGLERYLATGAATVLNRRIELTALRRDGKEFPIDLSITPLHSGPMPSFSAFIRDITDRKLAQARLQAQLERLTLLDQITRAIGERQDLQSIYQVAVRSLEERLPVDFCCVCRYDASNHALTVICVGAGSRALALALAMSEHSAVAVGQNGLSRCVGGELVYEPDVAGLEFAFPKRLADGGLRATICAPLQSESRVFGVLVAARRAPDSFSSQDCEFVRQLSGHVALAARQAELHAALQHAYDELRDSQQLVLQHERLRALGQMASGIAHDINNAISPAALYVENLLEHEAGLSERGRDQLTTIARAIDDVAATVARMREFYRQREAQVALVPVRLNTLVREVVDLTRARWSDMSLRHGVVIRMHTELADDLPVVLGVESELREALTNLVFNAVDAMPEGGDLTLTTRVAERRGADDRPGRVEVEVRDSGVGMDEATRRRCMEPFFTTKGERGTGLGLAMVYGVAQRHGADVGIDSAVGRGTTVLLSLPTPASSDPAAPAGAVAPAPIRRLRLLLVDDDPVLLHSLSEMLGLDGHDIVGAAGGQAGIDAFAAALAAGRPFDVVLTDLGMPYVDGRRVAGEVKAMSGGTPVIMLTGWGRPFAANGETLPNVEQVLGKPPKMVEIRATLARLTRPAAAQRPAGRGDES